MTTLNTALVPRLRLICALRTVLSSLLDEKRQRTNLNTYFDVVVVVVVVVVCV
jgi:hypothetical protein